MNRSDIFADAVGIIRKYYDGPIRPYMTVDYGRRQKESAISLVPPYPPEMNSNKLIETLHLELPDGYVSFLGNNLWLGEERFIGHELVVACSDSKFEALKLAETSGRNQGLSTKAIAEKLEEYDIEIAKLMSGTEIVELLFWCNYRS